MTDKESGPPPAGSSTREADLRASRETWREANIKRLEEKFANAAKAHEDAMAEMKRSKAERCGKR